MPSSSAPLPPRPLWTPWVSPAWAVPASGTEPWSRGAGPCSVTLSHPAASPLTALGLRTPLGVQSPYSATFGMAHPAVNGDMAGTGAYASLHLVSPQLNGAAAAVGAGSYGRSPLVREPPPHGAWGRGPGAALTPCPLQVGYDPHPHMRVPGLAAGMQVGTSGKP